MIHKTLFCGMGKLLIFGGVYLNKSCISTGDIYSNLVFLICLLICPHSRWFAPPAHLPGVLPLHFPLIRRKMRNCASLFNSMRISLQTSQLIMRLTSKRLKLPGSLELRKWLGSVKCSYRRKWMDCRRSGTRNAE